MHNLRVAAAEVDSGVRSAGLCRYRCAARSDNWLRQLVAPLADEELARRPVIAGLFRSKAGLLRVFVQSGTPRSRRPSERSTRRTFAGAVRLRFDEQRLRRLNISERWRGTVSDDFTLTRVLARSNCRFISRPIVWLPSVGDCDFRELLEFTTRQMKITRVYAPHLMEARCYLAAFLFCLVFLRWHCPAHSGGSLAGVHFVILLLALLLIFLLGAPSRSFAGERSGFLWQVTDGNSTEILPANSSSGRLLHCSISTTRSRRVSRGELSGAELPTN